ncbi:MAG: lipid biosynthesis B12-binding/radical SAM protein, partial [bacterium]
TVLRQASAAPVVLGGPAFSIMPAEILAHLGADYGVAGEGERVFCELIQQLEQGAPPTIRLLNGRAAPVPGAELPPPLLDPELVRFYLGHSGMLNLQTKRGCPHACTYCTYPSLEGAGYRPREPAAVVDDLARLRRDYGAGTVFFTDSVFNDAAGHYLEVAEAMVRSAVGLRWCGFFRPQGVGPQELALLKRSGLYAMEVGTDAACDASLAAAHKGFTFADVLAFNQAATAARIPCAHFVVFGWPGESAATLQEGLANLEQLERSVVFGFSGIRILPGTGLHARAIQDGVVESGTSLLRPRFYSSPALPAEAMNTAIEKAFGGRRDRIFPPSRGYEKLAVLHRFGGRGLLWDKLIAFP